MLLISSPDAHGRFSRLSRDDHKDDDDDDDDDGVVVGGPNMADIMQLHP